MWGRQFIFGPYESDAKKRTENFYRAGKTRQLLLACEKMKRDRFF